MGGIGEDSRADETAEEGVAAAGPRWRCCGARQQPAAAARPRQAQRLGGEGQQAEQVAPSPRQPSAADAASAVAAGAGAATPSSASQSERSPGRQRSLVHIKRFSTLLLRGSRAAAIGSGAALEQAEAGGQPAGQPGAAAGAPEEPLSLHSALSHPDSIIIDESGSWVCLADGANGSGGTAGPARAASMQRAGSRREPVRLHLP